MMIKISISIIKGDNDRSCRKWSITSKCMNQLSNTEQGVPIVVQIVYLSGKQCWRYTVSFEARVCKCCRLRNTMIHKNRNVFDALLKMYHISPFYGIGRLLICQD